MRLTHWVLGIVLGAFAGGSALVIGVLALLLVVPGLVWAARETARPLGFAGLLVGVGVAFGGLLAMADARCAAFNSSANGIVQSCSSPDATPFLTFAVAWVAVGALVTLVGLRRTGHATH
jgi:hypothetical protein